MCCVTNLSAGWGYNSSAIAVAIGGNSIRIIHVLTDRAGMCYVANGGASWGGNGSAVAMAKSRNDVLFAAQLYFAYRAENH